MDLKDLALRHIADSAADKPVARTRPVHPNRNRRTVVAVAARLVVRCIAEDLVLGHMAENPAPQRR